jgi:multicomponent Na+:H+ antiporter subunit E
MFAANILFAVAWAALIGPFTPTNLAAGYIVGYAALLIATGGRVEYFRRSRSAMGLALYTVYELASANLRVAWYTVSRLSDLKPAILAVPLEENLTDAEITLLGSLITLTPGTLTMDVSPDRSAMYIHFMHVDDADEAIAEIKSGFERRVLEVTR